MQPQQKIENLPQIVLPVEEEPLASPPKLKTELPSLASINISFSIRQNEVLDSLPSIISNDEGDVRKRDAQDFISNNPSLEQSIPPSKLPLENNKSKNVAPQQSIDSLGLISKTIKRKTKPTTGTSVPASIIEKEKKDQEKKERRKQREKEKKEKSKELVSEKIDGSLEKKPMEEEKPVQIIGGIIADDDSEEEKPYKKRVQLMACTVDEMKSLNRIKKIGESDGIEHHVKIMEINNIVIPLTRSVEETKYVGAMRENGSRRIIAENWFQSLLDQKKNLQAEVVYKKPQVFPKRFIKVRTLSKYSYLKTQFEQMIISKTQKDSNLKDKTEVLPPEKLGDGHELSDAILLNNDMIAEMIKLLKITPVEEFIPDNPNASKDHRLDYRDPRMPQPPVRSFSPRIQTLVPIYSAYDPKNMYNAPPFMPQHSYSSFSSNDYLNFRNNPYNISQYKLN